MREYTAFQVIETFLHLSTRLAVCNWGHVFFSNEKIQFSSYGNYYTRILFLTDSQKNSQCNGFQSVSIEEKRNLPKIVVYLNLF